MAMEDGMAVMFPNGIRTLLVDDDAKFLKSANKLLSFLKFEVVECSNVAHALNVLTKGDHDGFDVILVHAAKAVASGFNFRAIIEANLLIPVIYFLPQSHEATGDVGDKLLRALWARTYVIKKPVDANEVRSLLWKVITSRKCEVETKARRRGVQQGVVKGGCRKRKCSSSNSTGGSFFTDTTTAAGGHPAAKGKEKDNVASLQQEPQDVHHLLMFGPFPYQGPSLPAAEGGLFTSNMAGGAAAAAGAEARVYENDVSLSFLQPLNHGAAMVPQPFFRDAIDSVTMEWLLSDDFDDYVGGAPPLVAPNNQVPVKASNVDEPTATAGNSNAAPFMVPQDLSGGNNGDQVAQEDVIHGSLVGYDQGEGTSAAMDGNHAGLTVVAMPPYDDQDEDNTLFPLRDLYGPLSEFDDIVNLDFQLGGFTGGCANATDEDGDAGTSLNAGEEGGSSMDGLGNLDGLPIPYDLLENFMAGK